MKVATVAPLALYKEALLMGQLVRAELPPLLVDRGEIMRELAELNDLESLCSKADKRGEKCPVSREDLSQMKKALDIRYLDFTKRCMVSILAIKRGVVPLIREIRPEFSSDEMKEFEALLSHDLKHAGEILHASLERLKPED